MKAPLNIYPPKNWQDFETLCLKLWGEIWNIPHEIELNSDNSQGQNGVDIYGQVDGVYYGVQCKNRKLHLIDGSPNRLTIQDIRQEIEKAKTFRPSLRKLVIATSLPKDGRIEQFVREQSQLHAQNGLFTIQICFWDFFERKIFEFEKVCNWYIKNEDAHRLKQVSVTFKGDLTDEVFNPRFQKTVDLYINPPPRPSLEHITKTHGPISLGKALDMGVDFSGLNFDYKSLLPEAMKVEWNQYHWMQLCIENTGQVVIEDFKVELDFEGDFIRVGPEGRSAFMNPHFTNNVKGYSNTESGLYIKPATRTLVQGDGLVTGSFYLEPKVSTEPKEVKMHWNLLARDFSQSGTLLIKIIPWFCKVINRHEVNNPEEVREEVSYSLIKRPANCQPWGVDYFDNESDYKFDLE